MIFIEKFLCPDKIYRFIRLNEKPQKKIKKTISEKTLIIPFRFQEFEEIYSDLCFQYFAQSMNFCGRSYTRRKIKLLKTIFENLDTYRIRDAKLFLQAQFEKAKVYPRQVWPTNIASLSAIKVYQKWISKYNGVTDARNSHELVGDLERILSLNHKKFIYYREKTGMPDLNILRTRADEFDPLYLATYPEISEQLKSLSPPTRNRIESVLDCFTEPYAINVFYETARRVKCQVPISQL